jgi:hypothetical protein
VHFNHILCHTLEVFLFLLKNERSQKKKKKKKKKKNKQREKIQKAQNLMGERKIQRDSELG